MAETTNREQAERTLLEKLRDEGWAIDDLRKFASPMCKTLRDMARNNVSSREN